METHILGIRHHGPGSAHSVRSWLRTHKPDLLLVEGPPEMDQLAPYVTNKGMKPPVAILIHQIDAPQNAVFYPFARFSPEWQTMVYAAQTGTPIHFFDLPAGVLIQMIAEKRQTANPQQASPTRAAGIIIPPEARDRLAAMDPARTTDAIDYLAAIDGYADGEEWWDENVERQSGGDRIFEAIADAMGTLRESLPQFTQRSDLLREAWMRKELKAAQQKGYENIAVVCGAWHVPAIGQPAPKTDAKLLKEITRNKLKTSCTWIPWTYGRLSRQSGYGAGITSPGWYDHLWQHPDDDGSLWLTTVTQTMRRQGQDIGPSHSIAALRLAQSLTAIRGKSRPGLGELNEATITVMCDGDKDKMTPIREKLEVADRVGHVPDNLPKVPLLADWEQTQKRLKVPFSEEIKDLDLDLRRQTDLMRSVFFHRSELMEIGWAKQLEFENKGTFKETWELRYAPAQALAIVEKAIYGNTVGEACENLAEEMTGKATHIGELTRLLAQTIPADLPKAASKIADRLDQTAATEGDIGELLDAIGPLADIVRYGNVRNLRFDHIEAILSQIVTRVSVAGTQACSSVDDESAQNLYEKIEAANYAIDTVNERGMEQTWGTLLSRLRDNENVHPLLGGLATRIGYDKGQITAKEMARTLRFKTSRAIEPNKIAWWVDGCLRGTSLMLLLNDEMWQVVCKWVCDMDMNTVKALLPMLRRTFGSFGETGRRKIGERARLTDEDAPMAPGNDKDNEDNNPEQFDTEEANEAMVWVAQMLGIGPDEKEEEENL